MEGRGAFPVYAFSTLVRGKIRLFKFLLLNLHLILTSGEAYNPERYIYRSQLPVNMENCCEQVVSKIWEQCRNEE